MLSRTAFVVTTAVAIALVSFDLRPANATPEGVRGIAKQSSAGEFSGARKHRRGVHPGVPLAAFGAGTIAGIAAAERRREYYERHYYGGPYAYEAPYAYAPNYGYAQPYGYAPGHGHWGGQAPSVDQGVAVSPGH